MNKTSIEWCDFTSNPLKFRAPDGRVVWACEKLSAGCTNCYAEHLSTRYGGVRRAGDWNAATMATLTPFLDEKELQLMLRYTPAAGTRVFVGDMTDVFGDWVPDALLDQLFAVFAMRPDVTWQVLTKRAERMRAYLSTSRRPLNVMSAVIHRLRSEPSFTPKQHSEVQKKADALTPWPLPNVWLGVSVENQHFADERIPLLLQTPAAVRFISAEPLLGPLDIGTHIHRYKTERGLACAMYAGYRGEGQIIPALDWVIVGGESGKGARPFDVDWARSIKRQCREAGIACFIKQLGAKPIGWWSNSLGPRVGKFKDSHGGDMAEWPDDLRVREFPRDQPTSRNAEAG